MSLDTEEQVRQTWGSHIPLTTAVMRVLKPRSVLECGCGNYSTPILQESPDLLTVEHDPVWAEATKQKYPPKGRHEWRVFPVPAWNSTRRSELTPESLRNFENLYQGLSDEFWKSGRRFGLLFVDTFSAARVPAAITLSPFADMFIIHDTEPGSWEYYDWNLLKGNISGFQAYRFAPEGVINFAHRLPHTMLFSRRLLDVGALQPEIDKEASLLWGATFPLERIPW